MSGFVRGCLFAAFLAFANVAPAQKLPEAQDDSDIVVTGRPSDDEVRNFVDALTESRAGGRPSRFEWEVCPAAAGFAAGQMEEVVQRMRRVAKAADIRVAGARCTPNVLLIVAPDKRAFVEALYQRHPAYFGMSRSEMRQLAQAPGPAAAWHVDGPPLDADGVKVPFERSLGAPVNRTIRPPWRIASSGRVHFVAALVVVESKAVERLTTTQLADYAAMRAFAKADPRRADASASTILKVFDAPLGSPIPITLTAWDLGFLRALYGSSPELGAAAQRSQIRRHFEDDLAESKGARD